jgi:hypothetical protein
MVLPTRMTSVLATVTRDVVPDDGSDYRADRSMARVTIADFMSHDPANHTAENNRRGGR